MGRRKLMKSRRRTFVVDWKLQTTITLQLLAVLAGVGMLYALAVLVLPGGDRLSALSGQEVRTVLLRANAIYFGLGAAILGVIAMILTHRVAGPSKVLTNAVEGMARGEFHHRTSLRERDYLKGLASSLDALAKKLAGQKEERQKGLDDLEACLRENDLAAAREIVTKLRASDAVKPDAEVESESEKTPTDAESETVTA
jgi:HAMP domain-containing protein